jgi:SAM-dependent methyltransferase
MEDASTDRARLVDRAYKDSVPLRTRVALYDYEQNPLDLLGWVLDAVPWSAGARVLDAGCGPGRYLAHVAEITPDAALVGADLSAGMAREASAVANALVSDVQSLPFAAGAFNRVICAHMLYHVPDVECAVTELARVCTPEGRVLVVTNGGRHLPQIFDLVRNGLRGTRLAGVALPADRAFERFNVESAPSALESRFDIVEREERTSEIVIPHVEPVVDYVDSMQSLYDAWIAPGETWDDVMDRVRADVASTIDRDGSWRTSTHVGYFVCRPR